MRIKQDVGLGIEAVAGYVDGMAVWML